MTLNENKMRRPFDDINKIYRTADELAKQLVADFNYAYEEMENLFDLMGYGDELRFHDIIEIKSHRTQLKKAIQTSCLEMDYLYCTPILIDGISKYYEDKNPTDQTLFGVALKTALGFVWTGSYHHQARDSRSYSALKLILAKCVLYLVLEHIIRVWEQVDLSGLSLKKNGAVESDNFHSLNATLELQGRHEYKVIDEADRKSVV